MKTLCACLCVMLLSLPAHAQKRKTVKPTAKAQVISSPINIITAGFGRSERNEATCALLITNNDSKRTIKSIQWTATTIELLTQKPIDSFDLEADTLTPVAPKKGGYVYALLDGLAQQTNCLEYKAQERKTNDEIIYYQFMPNRCSRRWLFITVDGITFTDGSKWPAQETK